MSLALNLVGLFLGVAGVVGTVQLVQTIAEWYLPPRRLMALEELLIATDSLFRGSVEDGLLFDQVWAQDIEDQLAKAYIDLRRLRAQALLCPSWKQQVVATIGGLSSKISRVRRDLILLRSNIAAAAGKERKKLAGGSMQSYNYDVVGFSGPRDTTGHSTSRTHLSSSMRRARTTIANQLLPSFLTRTPTRSNAGRNAPTSSGLTPSSSWIPGTVALADMRPSDIPLVEISTVTDRSMQLQRRTPTPTPTPAEARAQLQGQVNALTRLVGDTNAASQIDTRMLTSMLRDLTGSIAHFRKSLSHRSANGTQSSHVGSEPSDIDREALRSISERLTSFQQASSSSKTPQPSDNALQ